MVDLIRLHEMVFYGYHGALPEERALGQRFIVDVELRADLRAAGLTDDLRQTVDYGAVYGAVREVVTGAACNLIETVAERVAARILADYSRVESVVIRIRKPAAPIRGSILGSAEVCIERSRGSQ
jgi:dihydroneopterin aldolase